MAGSPTGFQCPKHFTTFCGFQYTSSLPTGESSVNYHGVPQNPETPEPTSQQTVFAAASPVLAAMPDALYFIRIVFLVQFLGGALKILQFVFDKKRENGSSSPVQHRLAAQEPIKFFQRIFDLSKLVFKMA